MKQYNLIFLRSNKVLLSKRKYKDWKEIQDEYVDYMASIEFDTLKEIEEYIRIDYKLVGEHALREVSKIKESETETVELHI